MSRPEILPVRVCDPHFRRFAESPCGHLHSIYEGAVNIWNGVDLFAVVAGACFDAPYTGNTDEMSFLNYSLRLGEAVEGQYPFLRIGSRLVLDCSRVRVCGGGRWPGRGREIACARPTGDWRPEGGRLSSGIRSYLLYLREHGINRGCADFFRRYYFGERLPAPGCLQEEMNRRLLSLAQAADAPGRFVDAARKLVGAGGGLTPAGDDFLCGILSALGSCERAGSLWETLVEGIKGWSGLAATTAVSRQMLKAYLRGESSRLYRRLAVCFLDGGREMEAIMKLVEGIGHTSGIDFSAGMATGYCLILNRM